MTTISFAPTDQPQQLLGRLNAILDRLDYQIVAIGALLSYAAIETIQAVTDMAI